MNRIVGLLLPPGEESEFRFPMGELPQEVMEICERLAKLTENLRGLAELFLNDLSEKTGSHDIVRLHRVLLQMNRALGHFEAQSKLWRLASLAHASGAPVSKWVTRETREGQPHIFFHCVGIPGQRSARKTHLAAGAARGGDLRHAAIAEQLCAAAGDERPAR